MEVEGQTAPRALPERRERRWHAFSTSCQILIEESSVLAKRSVWEIGLPVHLWSLAQY
ncbi:MAG: hypothetical protein O7F12_13285 [Nitrospirae bacterium]|nr:hypothetical protein [Nitrospirota bacterium]